MLRVGTFASYSAEMALNAVNVKGVEELVRFVDATDNSVKEAVMWSLLEVCEYGPQLFQYIATMGVFQKIADHLHLTDNKVKTQEMLQIFIQNSSNIQALLSMSDKIEVTLLPHMLNQLIIIRGDNDLSRREMLVYGGLEAVQSIVTQPATELHHLKNALLKGFPGEAFDFVLEFPAVVNAHD